ncbi:MAG: insulinase family protein [Oscillospiraceae bacterium]|nr:insulinase family protein [Oscillospiraceae bacterium]
MIQIKTLPNGARIVHEYMAQVRSAAVVFWVGHGSRHEPAEMGGASHAIEHMLFKGTQTRTAAELAAVMDAIGGQVNAYTTKESTCYYARALDSHLPAAIDLLGDMFFNARFDKDAWDTERGVIIEEIAMCEDQPDDLVYQNLYASIYKDLPLGAPVIGTAETLGGMTAEDLLEYKTRNYRPCDIIVSLAGRFAPSDLEKIEELLSSLPPAECPPMVPCAYTPAFHLREKDIEQNHLLLAFPGLPVNRNYAYGVMSAILGSGMSSRLFQKIREEHGLCYSVYSSQAPHRDTGAAVIYTALGPETERKALELIREVVEQYAREGPSEQELTRAREQCKANNIMSEESTVNRSISIGHSTLFFGGAHETDEIIARINAVTREAVTELAARIFDFSQVSLSVVGKPEDEAVYRDLLCR